MASCAAKVSMAFIFAIVALSASSAQAARFFVRNAIAEPGTTADVAASASRFVQSSVAMRSADQLVGDEAHADYVLQPRILRMADGWILTVEKSRGADTLFAAQTKIARMDQLNAAAQSATSAAIEEPSVAPRARGPSVSSEPAPVAPYQVVAPAGSSSGATSPPTTTTAEIPPTVVIVPPVAPAPSGATSVAQPAKLVPPARRIGYWTVGAGPFISRRLSSDNVMYDVAGGYTWDINPMASVKIIGEGNFSSGGEGARFLNLSAGANYFFLSGIDTAPYVTADIGYGFARDADSRSAEGFSLGSGVGLRFFRTTETTMDLLLRYAVIFDPINDEGNPAVVGARLAVNF